MQLFLLIPNKLYYRRGDVWFSVQVSNEWRGLSW